MSVFFFNSECWFVPLSPLNPTIEKFAYVFGNQSAVRGFKIAIDLYLKVVLINELHWNVKIAIIYYYSLLKGKYNEIRRNAQQRECMVIPNERDTTMNRKQLFSLKNKHVG